MTTTTLDFDQTKADAFGNQLLGILNGASIALMISIGHRTRLFDVMAGMPPSSSAQIAAAAGKNERYVREWLGAMVTGRVVDYAAEEDQYHLPAEHAASLTREARPNNLAATCQWIPVIAKVEDEVISCFERGGGVPYSAYERFHEVMAEESDQTVVAVLTQAILPGIPGVIDALEAGIDVLDVGCGSGRALNLMAATYPQSRFTGYDVSAEAVAVGKAEATARGLENLRFEVRDVSELDTGGHFDLITAFDAIHDQAHPDRVLAGIARALRPNGTFLMQDIAGSSHVEKDVDHPIAAFLYTMSCMHCMTVSLASEGRGLGAMWGRETACRMLNDAGFRKIDVSSLPHDVINYYYIARKT